jgi:N-methylhydantoinase A/oxoprolinase/acetone carboxylase beta subunit
MGSYLTDLQRRLPDEVLYIQQSNGGFLPARSAAELAVHTIVSGMAFRGPVLIVEEMATLLVLPEFDGRVDSLGHIHVQFRKS